MSIDIAVALVITVSCSIFACALLHDGWQLKRLMNSVLTNSSIHSRPLLTSIGLALHARLEALRYRLDALSWEVNVPHPKLSARDLVRSLPTSAIVAEPSSALLDSKAKATSGSTREQQVLGAFVERIFRLTIDGFRSRAVALILPVSDLGDLPNASSSSAGTRVWSHGVAGARWEGQLRTMLAPWLDRGDTEPIGLRDSSSHKSLTEEFSPYGFPFTMVLPIVWEERMLDGTVQDYRGALWLGYAANRAPLQAEEHRGQELSELIGRELSALQRLRALSGRLAVVEEVNRQKSDFIAQMSHDIRSPLNNIKAILGLFTTEESPADANELVRVAISNCDSMGEIVEGILDYSRHASGHLIAHPELVDLHDLVSAVVQSFMFAARQKGLSLGGPDQVAGTARTFLVNADRRHIKRLVSNLVSNAIKYTLVGSVRVELSIFGSKCEVRIRDTGCGLSAMQIEKLFTPFSRFHTEDAQMKSVEGIGLGLAVSRILAELNHGTINVQSKPLGGSCFTVVLPRAVGTEQILIHPTMLISAPRTAESNIVAPLLHLRPMILLVDDDLDYLMSMERNLRQSGFDIRCASSVEKAIESLRIETPDIVITDGQMPDGGGKKLIEVLRSMGLQTPALVASGHDDAQTVSGFRLAGASHVMTKPLEISELVTWLRGQLPAPSDLIPSDLIIDTQEKETGDTRTLAKPKVA